MVAIDIDYSAIPGFANQLSQLNAKGIAYAVRNTLNALALDVKKNTMPAESGMAFVNRNKTFFKSNSRVEFAKGRDINGMNATVGMLPIRGQKPGNKAHSIEDLAQQEKAGVIDDRDLLPAKWARVGASMTRNVRTNLRLSTILNAPNLFKQANMVNTNKWVGFGRNRRQQSRRIKNKEWVVLAALQGRGIGNFVMSKPNRGQYSIAIITGLTREKEGYKVKTKTVYYGIINRKVDVNAKHFMEISARKTVHNILAVTFGNQLQQQILYLQQRRTAAIAP